MRQRGRDDFHTGTHVLPAAAHAGAHRGSGAQPPAPPPPAPPVSLASVPSSSRRSVCSHVAARKPLASLAAGTRWARPYHPRPLLPTCARATAGADPPGRPTCAPLLAVTSSRQSRRRSWRRSPQCQHPPPTPRALSAHRPLGRRCELRVRGTDATPEPATPLRPPPSIRQCRRRSPGAARPPSPWLRGTTPAAGCARPTSPDRPATTRASASTPRAVCSVHARWVSSTPAPSTRMAAATGSAAAQPPARHTASVWSRRGGGSARCGTRRQRAAARRGYQTRTAACRQHWQRHPRRYRHRRDGVARRAAERQAPRAALPCPLAGPVTHGHTHTSSSSTRKPSGPHHAGASGRLAGASIVVPLGVAGRAAGCKSAKGGRCPPRRARRASAAARAAAVIIRGRYLQTPDAPTTDPAVCRCAVQAATGIVSGSRRVGGLSPVTPVDHKARARPQPLPLSGRSTRASGRRRVPPAGDTRAVSILGRGCTPRALSREPR